MTAPTPPTVEEIGELLAWCRRLSEAGPHRADAGELAAYQAAKAQLLARITSDQHHTGMPAGDA